MFALVYRYTIGTCSPYRRNIIADDVYVRKTDEQSFEACVPWPVHMQTRKTK